jgi:hypothetical protein
MWKNKDNKHVHVLGVENKKQNHYSDFLIYKWNLFTFAIIYIGTTLKKLPPNT